MKDLEAIQIDGFSRYYTLKKNIVNSQENLVGVGPNSGPLDQEFYTTQLKNSSKQGFNFGKAVLNELNFM